MEVQFFTVKLGLLAFWTVWYLIAFLTNLFGGLKSLRLLSEKWKFASDNFEAVRQATTHYRLSPWVPVLLFSLVVLWQFSAVVLFGWAFTSSFKLGSLHFISVNAAFAAGIGLWAAFMIADEIFMRYENEPSHAVLFIAQLVTWMSFYVLPS